MKRIAVLLAVVAALFGLGAVGTASASPVMTYNSTPAMTYN